MAIKQLTVFIENKKGTVVSVTEILAANNVNIRALSVAETQDFGMLRLIVNDETTAEKALAEKGYLFRTIDVVGVKIDDQPGKLSAALSVMEKQTSMLNTSMHLCPALQNMHMWFSAFRTMNRQKLNLSKQALK